MLNISENSISASIDLHDFSSSNFLRRSNVRRLPLILVLGMMLGLLVCLFLPWTQNVSAKGYVTTRSPQQRPQAIQSVIAGRIEEWFVREGDFVEQGDTIVFISEVKSEYFDPDLLTRTSEQIEAKSLSVQSYDEKVKALQNQYSALRESQELKREQLANKIEQAKNKIGIDSIDLVAFKYNLEIAENQLGRTKELHDRGLKSLNELQEKELKVRADRAKVNVQQNKVINQRNELANLAIEMMALEREFQDKLAKSRSDRQSAISAKLESVANVSKLRNQLTNYTQRQQLYFVTAPQAGFITKVIKKGIGETVKEGTDIVTIMPAEYDLAVETYIRPQDLPLLSLGNEVRLRFDGWPAIVISGWPEAATGVFSGEIVAIDQFIGDNGYYRILISPRDDEKEWPTKLKIGTGANAFMLLNEVPLWYEIWRQLNGFPADYYQIQEDHKKPVKQKAPLKSIK